MATSEKRVNVSVQKETVDTMDFQDWKLSFNYKSTEGKEVNQIAVTGTKPTKDGVTVSPAPYFNYNHSAANVTLTFSPPVFDNALVTAVTVEVNKIITDSIPVS